MNNKATKSISNMVTVYDYEKMFKLESRMNQERVAIEKIKTKGYNTKSKKKIKVIGRRDV